MSAEFVRQAPEPRSASCHPPWETLVGHIRILDRVSVTAKHDWFRSANGRPRPQDGALVCAASKFGTCQGARLVAESLSIVRLDCQGECDRGGDGHKGEHNGCRRLGAGLRVGVVAGLGVETGCSDEKYREADSGISRVYLKQSINGLVVENSDAAVMVLSLVASAAA